MLLFFATFVALVGFSHVRVAQNLRVSAFVFGCPLFQSCLTPVSAAETPPPFCAEIAFDSQSGINHKPQRNLRSQVLKGRLLWILDARARACPCQAEIGRDKERRHSHKGRWEEVV